MRIVNKLEYWRAQYCAKVGRIVDQKEFAKLLGIDRSQYNRYERHATEPSENSYDKILEKLGEIFPDKDIQPEDLIEVKP